MAIQVEDLCYTYGEGTALERQALKHVSFEIQDGEFVTMDFGFVYHGYCSDMTRTVAVGHVTEEMRRVYDTVLTAQKAGIAAARAGVTGREVDGAARRVIEEA